MKLIATFVLLAFTITTARAEEDPKKVLESFQGEWKVVECHFLGEAASKEEIKNAKIVFSGSKMTVHQLITKSTDESTIVLDPKATPATIDSTPSKKSEKAMKGIYKLEKDKLTISFDLEARPKDFKPGKDNMVLVLERVKK